MADHHVHFVFCKPARALAFACANLGWCQYALFVFGSIAIASKDFYKVEESDKNTFIALASVLWVAVVVLECIVASKSASDSDWDELNLASSVMHLVFATMIAVRSLRRANCLRGYSSLYRSESTSTALAATRLNWCPQTLITGACPRAAWADIFE